MGSIPCEQESWVSTRNLGDVRENDQTQNLDFLDDGNYNDGDLSYQETEKVWQNMKSQNNTFTKNFNKGSLRKIQRRKSQVLLEGYVEGSSNNEDDLKRTKSLTDDDLDELKGCLDLGFGFSYDEIPELCNTLPALELCYSMSQKFLDEHQKPPERSSPADSEAASSSPIANWKISSPGDHPEDVKARLKFWAQTVACTVRLCS